jgi:membrane-associated phospholipid phosphatase
MGVKQQWPLANSEVLRAGSGLVWALIAAMAAAATAACWAARLSITWHSFPTIPVVIVLCTAVTLFYRFFRPDPGIVYTTELITQILWIIFLGELLAYAAGASGLPYRDAELMAADRWLGFNLRGYLGFVNTRPWLMKVSLLAYMSMLWQPPIVFVVLMVTRRIERLQDFAVSLIVSLAITITVFALFPALGWYGYLHISAADFPNLSFFSNFVSHLEDVRSGALRAIPLDDIRGIISFPSYHAAAAVLAVWAVWPVRVVRWPLLVLNALMMASTPIEGTHYFVDVIGGVIVSMCSVLAATWARHRVGRHYAVGTAQRAAPGASRAVALDAALSLGNDS